MERSYDFALSFAGEDRAAAEDLAEALQARGATVFYDKNEQASLLGKNLYDHLVDLYKNRAKFVVIFASKHYAAKNWTRLERQSAQARAFEQDEYILPLRIDDTEIPGILPTTAYLQWDLRAVDLIADTLVAKLRAAPIDAKGRRRLTWSQIERGLLRALLPFLAYVVGLSLLLHERKINWLTAILFGAGVLILVVRDLLSFVFGVRNRLLFAILLVVWFMSMAAWAVSYFTFAR